MRSPGTTTPSALVLGACFASAVIKQCSCFTASPLAVVAPGRGGRARCSPSLSARPSARVPSMRLSGSGPTGTTPAAAGSSIFKSGSSTPANCRGAASNAPRLPYLPAASAPTPRQRRKLRRRTKLLSTKERIASNRSSSSINSSTGIVKNRSSSSTTTTTTTSRLQGTGNTSRELRAEVAARRANGARFPAPAPQEDEEERREEVDNKSNFDSNCKSGDGAGASLRGDDVGLRLSKEAAAAAAVPLKLASTETRRQDEHEQSRQGLLLSSPARDSSSTPERDALLDTSSSHPPLELLLAAEKRSVGDGETIVDTPSKSMKGEEEEGGVSLWASRGMLAGAAMLYGTNFGCVKLLEETVPMSLAAALRFSVAVVPFLPFLRNIKPAVFKAGAEIGVLNAIGYWAQSESLMTTTASKSAFICSLAVVLVPLLDAVFGAKDSAEVKASKAAEKEQAGGVFSALNGPWFPALLAATGVACLELIGVEGGPNSGDVWALVQPLCFGIGFWRTERLSRKFPEDTFGLVAAQLLTVALLAGSWCALAHDVPLSLESLRETILPSSGRLEVPISLLWTGLVTTALTVFGETFAMKKISAAESTIILSTEPIWGTAFASVLLGETIGWNTGLGAVLIVSACTWSSVGPALQSRVSSMLAATGVAAGAVGETGGALDVDDLTETVGIVVKELL